MRSAVRLLIYGLTLVSPLLQAAPHAHSHGAGTLDIAVEAGRITIRFESPLDNLVGFERAPRTDRESRQVESALARLNGAEALFRIDPAAGCKLERVELQSAALKLGQTGANPTTAAAGHADIDANFEFQCVDAAKAGYIDHGLFEFERLQRLAVQVAAPGGQFKRELKRPARRLALGK